MAYHIPDAAGTLAPNGTTGNNTHTGITVDDADGIGFQFVVEAIGATPTVTFQVQGCLDPSNVSDANANWQNIPYYPVGSDTLSVAAQTVTTVGATVFYLDFASGSRFFRRYRLVTSANTNVTYHGSLFKRVEN